jgi:DNA-binding beta-propeller fold protein YncE
MSVFADSAALKFDQLTSWERLPDQVQLMECSGVAVDSEDRVFVLTRNTENPVIVFDDSGEFLYSFGQGVFSDRTHAISLDSDDMVYCVDDGTHTITKFSPKGELLMTIGVPNTPTDKWSGLPFNRPTDVVASAVDESLFVSDGYGNARVHHYSADGQLLHSWGSPGIDSGQFMCPHNIAVDGEGLLYVADREAHRVQVFDYDGHFVRMYNNIHRPCGLAIGPDGNIYIGELCAIPQLRDAPGLGHRVTVMSRNGELLGRFGSPIEGYGAGEFIAPHGIAVNSDGAVYVSEVSYTMYGHCLAEPRFVRSLSKLLPA